MDLSLGNLRTAFQKGVLTPARMIAGLEERMLKAADDCIWISRFSRERLEALARDSDRASGGFPRPLAGIPFAIKDNIDLAGLPTTAACREFSYEPARSAHVVDRLVAAGALPLGKTNMDQFATGLVGVRSPYGVPRNPYGMDYIPGGSSSGSAVAVAMGLCSFSLGTDTAGSGRVPAAFNNLVGFKPTRGLVSTRGVVPACRSLDCVSLFTRNVSDAAEVFSVVAGFDPEDPFSRHAAPPAGFPPVPARLGIPRMAQLEFFGDISAPSLFRGAVERWSSLGVRLVEVDVAPFLEAARLLYEGPWVAERYSALKPFLASHAERMHPVTRRIIEPAAGLGAVEYFEAEHKLAALRARAQKIFSGIDALLLPTAPTIYRVEEVLRDPIALNSRLGTYTNFMNLLDMCGLALPAGFLKNGLPWGVTLAAPAFHDDRLLALGAQFLGEPKPVSVVRAEGPTVDLAVCGAHLLGLPLNWQLNVLGARFKKALKTSPEYRLYALPGTTPPKPGLVRVGEGGAAIEVEVWEMPLASYGYFVAQIPSPLGIGTLRLSDGSQTQGFLCEASAVAGALDISHLGGWRAFLKQGATG